MAEDEILGQSSDALWVLVRAKDSIYAVNGIQVESILVLDSDIIRLPNSDELNLGTVFHRGGVIPVLDFRCIVGMESRASEQGHFEQMLEDRKQDHIRWVDALKRSAETDEPFKLATDPHQCAFGKWYDNYKPEDQTVSFHLKKIDEPHKNLHGMALEVIACKQEHDECKRAECLKVSLNKAMEQYMPQVVHLLEESKQVFRDSYRQMVVVLSDETSSCGILVDEVLSAEPLGAMVPTCKRSGDATDALVTHVGERKDNLGNVLVVSLEQLFARYV